jgi:DNA-binding NarL/FixJ family response regulator
MNIIRTLIVDDSREFIQAANRFLKTAPRVQVVDCVHDGSQVLERIEKLRPDLVLLDISMPDVDGFEALRQIRGLDDPPKVIILTLYDTAIYRSEAEKFGADGFLHKNEFGVDLLPLMYRLFPDE